MLLNREEEVTQIKALLRLLQLFCEGHHINFQNYLRLQDHTSQSNNMVSEVMGFMKDIVASDMDKLLCEIALQGFNTLTEFCQGPCPENQAALVQCNVCNEVNIVFQVCLSCPLCPWGFPCPRLSCAGLVYRN